MTNIVYPQVAFRQCYDTSSFPTLGPALFNSNLPLLLDLIRIGIPPQIRWGWHFLFNWTILFEVVHHVQRLHKAKTFINIQVLIQTIDYMHL